jgi:hypothetical protein
MPKIAIATVLDEGAAELLVSSLDLKGIAATIQRVPHNPYLGAPTSVSLEVRVDAERVAEARTALEMIAADTPGTVEWDEPGADAVPAPPAATDEDEEVDEPGPGVRRPRLWIGAALPFVIPVVPVVGLFYAGRARAGWLLLSIGVTAVVLATFTRDLNAVMLLALVKAIDVVATPLLVALANRRAGGRDSVGLGAALSIVFALAAIACAAAVARARGETG